MTLVSGNLQHRDRDGKALFPLAECVINVSEGRDHARLRELARTAAETPGTAVLDWDADVDHHRTVFTLAGSLPSLEQAVAAFCRRTVDRDALRFWQVLANYKLAAIAMTGVRSFCDGRTLRVWSGAGLLGKVLLAQTEGS